MDEMTSATMDGTDVLIGILHLSGRRNIKVAIIKPSPPPTTAGTFCFAFLLPTLPAIIYPFAFNALQPEYLSAKIALVNGNSVGCGETVNTHVSRFW